MLLPWIHKIRSAWKRPVPSSVRYRTRRRLAVEQLETRLTPAVLGADLLAMDDLEPLNPAQLGDQDAPEPGQIQLVESATINDEIPAEAWARIFTDQFDYGPGDTATIYGEGFEPLESVTLVVVHADGNNGGEGHTPWTVQADANGSFQTTWYVSPDDSLGATFIVSADGSDGSAADYIFTDASPHGVRTSVDLTSPTSSDPDKVNDLPETIEVSFNYTSSTQAYTTATVGVYSGNNLVAYKTEYVTSGSNRSDTIDVTLPSNLSDGNYKVVVVVNNSASGSDQSTQGSAIRIDTHAPSKPSTPDLVSSSDTGTSSTDNITRDNTPKFAGNAEDYSLIKIYIDGSYAGWTQADDDGDWSYTTSRLDDGYHQIRVTATDSFGNTSVLSNGRTILIDTVGPSVSTSLVAAYSDGPDAETGWYNMVTGAPTWSYTVNDDNGSDIVGPRSKSYTFGNGEDQSQSFEIRDVAGNETEICIRHIDVDLTPPYVIDKISPREPESGWYNAESGPPVHSYFAIDNTSGFPSAHYRYYDNDVDHFDSGSYTFDEGEGMVHTFSVKDRAGNVTEVTSEPVSYDKTPPRIVAHVSGAPSETGWYNLSTGAPTITFEACDDDGSEIVFVTGPITLGEGENQSVTGYAYDAAGNCYSVTLDGFNVDLTPPTITASIDKDAAETGWYNIDTGAPTVSFTASDSPAGNNDGDGVITFAIVVTGGEDAFSGSGVAWVSESVTVGEGRRQSVTGYAYDVAGNSASATIDCIHVDLTAPEVTASVDRDPASTGWYNLSTAAPIVNFGSSDEGSGIAYVSAPITVGEGANQSITGYAYDEAGNYGSATVDGLNVDLTPPTITANVSHGPAETGWYNLATGAPIVSYSATDSSPTGGDGGGVISAFIFGGAVGFAGSGIASVSESVSVGEGQNQTFTGYAYDVAGNSASATIDGINVDLTPPTITATVSPPSETGWYDLSTGAPTVTFSATDGDGSGIDTVTSPVVVPDGSRGYIVQGVATDVAGNIASIDIGPFTVDLTPPAVINLQVNNQSPDLGLHEGVIVGLGQSISGTFELDHPFGYQTFDVTLDYGDGTEPVTLEPDRDGVFTIPAHTYATASNFQLVVSTRNLSQVIFIHVLNPNESSQVKDAQVFVADMSKDVAIKGYVEDAESGKSMTVNLSIPAVKDYNGPSPTLSIVAYNANPNNPASAVIPLGSGAANSFIFVDIRTTDIQPEWNAELEVNLVYTAQAGQEDQAIPCFFANGQWTPVAGTVISRTSTPKDDGTVQVTLTLKLTNDSNPTVYDVGGTIFTVAVPAPPQAPTVATYSVPTLSFASINGSQPNASASFSTSTQLTLVLRVSNSSDLSTSRSTVSGDSTSGGYGDYEGDLIPRLRSELGIDWLLQLLGEQQGQGQGANPAPEAQPE